MTMLWKLISDAVTMEKMVQGQEDSKHKGPEAWCTARVQQGSRIPVEGKRGAQ